MRNDAKYPMSLELRKTRMVWKIRQAGEEHTIFLPS